MGVPTLSSLAPRGEGGGEGFFVVSRIGNAEPYARMPTNSSIIAGSLSDSGLSSRTIAPF